MNAREWGNRKDQVDSEDVDFVIESNHCLLAQRKKTKSVLAVWSQQPIHISAPSTYPSLPIAGTNALEWGLHNDQVDSGDLIFVFESNYSLMAVCSQGTKIKSELSIWSQHPIQSLSTLYLSERLQDSMNARKCANRNDLVESEYPIPIHILSRFIPSKRFQDS